MRHTRNFPLRSVLVISVLVSYCSVLISGVPQWVWNPGASTAPARGDSGNKIIFNGQFADDETDKVPLKLADTQPRLFLPGILNAISNSIRPNRPGSSSSSSASSSGSSGSSYPPPVTGGGSSSSGGGGGGSSSDSSCNGGSCSGSCNSGACIGGSIASQAVDQGINAGSEIAQNQGVSGVFGNLISNIFGGSASTLPGSIGGGGGSGDRVPVSGSCTCVDHTQCFLPNKATGDCDSSGRRVRCCSTTRGSRTLFPEDDDRVLSNSVNSVRTVTRSQIRRALLKNIVRGSGSLIDDTLDLILHPFLTKEDQLKVATRVIDTD